MLFVGALYMEQLLVGASSEYCENLSRNFVDTFNADTDSRPVGSL